MEKIQLENIIKSFFLGIVIGIIMQFVYAADAPAFSRLIMVLVSGSLGFVIGFITEFITAVLPIRLAKPLIYFGINGIIAILVTSLIMLASILLTRDDRVRVVEFLPQLGTVLVIVCFANLAEFFLYRRAQKKLKLYQEQIHQ